MKPSLNPAPIIEIATAYWSSATLIAAIRLALFTRLDEGPATAGAIAARAETDPVATDALLSALVSLGLVE